MSALFKPANLIASHSWLARLINKTDFKKQQVFIYFYRMIKALIIDDEASAANVTCMLLKKYCPALTELKIAVGAEEGKLILGPTTPILFFLILKCL